MTTNPSDLTLELRSANGTSTELYQSAEERIQETLHLLVNPRLLTQPHLVFASEQCASMVPCKGIDMILAHTAAWSPTKFPLPLPLGLLDLVEKPEGWGSNHFIPNEDRKERHPGQGARHTAHVEIHTLGGWRVILKAVAQAGNVQDERQFFAHLRNVPAFPFRLLGGGMGLINTTNITRASAWPRPDLLPGPVMPLDLRESTPSFQRGKQPSATDAAFP